MWMSSVYFGAATAQVVALKMEKLKDAERRLLDYARRHFLSNENNEISIGVMDTKIPKSSVPLLNHETDIYNLTDEQRQQQQQQQQQQHYIIHSVHVVAAGDKNQKNTNTQVPLVLLHGYMNGGAYFYRNFAGLSKYFSSIHALDLLGWGLSSRPNLSAKNLVKKSDNDDDRHQTQAAEDFFVESLEAWRKENKIEKFALAGHSMGGYLSVAYCERYPQNVDRLILISPVGVPDETAEERQARVQRIQNYSYTARFFVSLWSNLFAFGATPGDMLRWLPESTARNYAYQYVTRRLPAISNTDEQEAVSDYLFHSNTLPGSGEYCLDKILTESILARRPLQHRIPKLAVPSVGFLYGAHDWMDKKGGLAVKEICDEKHNNGEKNVPSIDVYSVSQSGHLLMLENWQEFNAGVRLCAGQSVADAETLPTKLEISREPEKVNQQRPPPTKFSTSKIHSTVSTIQPRGTVPA